MYILRRLRCTVPQTSRPRIIAWHRFFHAHTQDGPTQGEFCFDVVEEQILTEPTGVSGFFPLPVLLSLRSVVVDGGPWRDAADLRRYELQAWRSSKRCCTLMRQELVQELRSCEL
jgi:hypothetical protein